MSSLWLPASVLPSNVTASYTMSWEEWERLERMDRLVGVCKCGHAWIMHYHHGNPGRPGTSCDDYMCQARGTRGCKRYRLRRVRSLRRRKTLART